MASGSLASELAVSQGRIKAEAWLRYAAIALTVGAGLGMALHLATAIWAEHEFTQPESIVAAQASMVARDGYFYGSLKDYPYTVNAYMPVYYLLEAGMVRLGFPIPLGGRLISFGATLGMLAIVWRMLLLYTDSRHCAYLGTLVVACTSLVWMWGSTGRADPLAVFLSLTAFYYFSRYWVRQEATIGLAATFALGSMLVKQTSVSAPAAIFLLLLFHSPKQAFRFGAMVAGVLGAVVLAANALTNGGFLANTVFANINPFAWDKFKQHVDYMELFAAQLILVVGICAPRIWKTPARAVLVYLGIAASVLAVTAAKVGSDSNYQIELTILLAVVSALGLHAVNFFPRFFSGDKALITLLHLPLGVHMLLNLRLMYPSLLQRVAIEQAFRQQVSELRPLVGDGPVLIADPNSAFRLRGKLEVEALIYTLLVEAGQIDPEPLRKDLAARKFSTIVLYTDVEKRIAVDPEISRLVESQNAEIRQHYTLVKHVAGPYMNGLFVYKPKL